MGVDTKAILFGAPGPHEISAVLMEAFYCEVTIHNCSSNAPAYTYEMFALDFADPAIAGRDRRMFVHPHTKSQDFAHVFQGEHTACSLGCWGSSVQIMEALVSVFGGFVCDADTVDEWRLVEGSDQREWSTIDRLRADLAAALGNAGALPFIAIMDDPKKVEAVACAYGALLDADRAD